MANWKEVEITDSGKIALNRVNSGNSAYRLKITKATFNTKSGKAVQEAESLDWHDVQPFLDENGEEITDSLSYVLDIFLNNKSEILADSGLESGAEQYELGSVSIYGTLYRVNETGDEVEELTDELLTLRVKDGESGDLVPIGEGSPALYAKYTIRFSINSSTTGGRIYVTPKVISVDEFNRYKETLNTVQSDIVDLSTNKLEVVVVDELPTKQSNFKVDSLSNTSVHNSQLSVKMTDTLEGEEYRCITSKRVGSTTYAGAISDLSSAIPDISEALSLVISMDFKMSAQRWHVSLVDKDIRGDNAAGSYANNLISSGIAITVGNNVAEYFGANNTTTVTDSSLWKDKWLHAVFEFNSESKKVKYNIYVAETGDSLMSGELDSWDSSIKSVNGIEFYTWVSDASIYFRNIGITANYEDVSKSVVYVVSKNGEYIPYLYVNNIPVPLTDAESIESLLNSSKVLGSDIEILKESSHIHENKTVLDGISSTDIANWDAKVDNDDLPNIKKNPDDTTGDIIDTHLTIGSRNVHNDTRDFLTVYGGINQYRGSTKLGEGSSSVEFGKAAIPVQHGYARHMALLSRNIKTVGGNDTVFINSSGVDRDAAVEGNWEQVVTINAMYPEFASHQIITGHYNSSAESGAYTGTRGTAFIIGNGTADTARSNAFRVAYNGSVYGAGAYNSTGADIAELYEWLDGNPDNEDRRGLFVTLDGTKIKLAEPTDTYIKGVISAAPALVGDSYSDTWHGMYLTDVFGVPLKQTVHHDAEYMEVKKTDPETGEETTEQVLIHDEYDAEEYILNPDYDPEQEYIPREQRQEYDYVSSWGKLVIVDDGTCEVNGFATVGEGGKATKSDTQTIYRVMERKDETHIFVAIG